MQTTWYIHNLNPIAFTIGEEVFPWYWLNYAYGFLWCYFGLKYLTKNSDSKLNGDDITHIAVWSWFGMLLGARVTYILLYNFNWFKTHPDQIIAIWNGGMSFHGGLIGIGLTAWIVTTLRRVDFFTFTDRLAVLIPWPLATGRICNFLNGELPGRPTGVSWAVIFPEPWNDFPRHPSQLYEALAEGVILGLIMYVCWKKLHLDKKHGALSCVFLAGYGSLRFLTEFTREPDPQLGLLFQGMTLGQILCLTMIAFAVYLASKINQASQ